MRKFFKIGLSVLLIVMSVLTTNTSCNKATTTRIGLVRDINEPLVSKNDYTPSNVYDANGDLATLHGFDYSTTSIARNNDGKYTYSEKWIGSYGTLLFDTPDGDLDMREYALDGTGTGYYIRTVPITQGQFIHIGLDLKDEQLNQYSITDKSLVSIINGKSAYYDEFLTMQGAIDDWTINSKYYGVDFILLPSGDVARRPATVKQYLDLSTIANASQPKRVEAVATSKIPAEPIGLPNGDGIGYDNATASGYKSSVSSYTFSHTCGATANLLVFGGGDFANPYQSITGVTYNSATMTFIRQDASSTLYYSSIWFMYAPSTGSAYTVAVTLSGTCGAGGGCVSYSGAAQSGQPDANNGANAGTGVPTVNVVTNADNCWVVASLTSDRDHATAQTQRWASNSAYRFYGSDTNAPKTPAGIQTMNWATNLWSWTVSAASFAPAASGTYNLTNSPSSIGFGVIQPNTKYYAYGSAPSNPITDGQCTFTITNSQANIIKVNIQATNFTGGGGWTLGAPDGTHARLIAYYSGQNPASGVTLTTSPQTFVASLASSTTIKWDFSWETATSFADGTQKSSTITLTGVVP